MSDRPNGPSDASPGHAEAPQDLPYLTDHARFNRDAWNAESDGPDATSRYRDELEREWSRRWPAESIWRVRKAG